MNDTTKQTNIFGEVQPVCITIDTASIEANVSLATIRNWIKTGYLQSPAKGLINRTSFDTFMKEVAGKDKLVARANKIWKDSHNHASISHEIQKIVASAHISSENWATEYENSLANAHRNKEGIYYTPQAIVADMLVGIDKHDITTKIFCDPCCGGGNFIIEAIEAGFLPENIVGFDTDANAVAITKKRIFDKTGYDSPHIVEADFLEKSITSPQQFDYIFTNPPWGKKINKDLKDKYAHTFKAGKSIDTSSLFLFACLEQLAPQGKLGFLLPESFFNIATFQDARQKAFAYTINRLIDYDKPFKGLVTKAQAIILSKEKAITNEYPITCQINNKIHQRVATSFISNPKKIMNFWIDESASAVIHHIYNLHHILLEKNATWGLGIVTGNNTKYAQNAPSKGYMPVYKGSDILANGLKEPSVYIPNDISLYQQVAPKHLYEADVKIIYKFISSNLGFFCDREQRYILNSANMLILKKGFPITSEQFCTLFNSEFMNWLFQSLFNTHKVLRGDLETLPIHIDYFKTHPIFDENTFLTYLNIEKVKNGTYRIKE